MKKDLGGALCVLPKKPLLPNIDEADITGRIPILIAVVLIAFAWKVLRGIVKTVALVAILAAVAVWVFFGGGLGA